MADEQPTYQVLNRDSQGVSASHMDAILPSLYLGNAFAARNKQQLASNGITHILSVIRDESSPDVDEGITRMNVAVDDWPDEDLLEHFADTNTFISKALLKGAILVHCLQGVSRSATVVAAYLMSTSSMSAHDAISTLRAKRAIVSPNSGFLHQLEIYESSGYDMHSEKGVVLHKAWQQERDAAYAKKVKELEQL